jgi:hypothetical protein
LAVQFASKQILLMLIIKLKQKHIFFQLFLGPIPNVSIIALQQKLNDPFSAIESISTDFNSIHANPPSTQSAHLAAHRIVQDRTQYLRENLHLFANEYIEDHDPEWRDLDYSSDVGPPPKNFCQFILQYDWNIFSTDRLNNRLFITFF